MLLEAQIIDSLAGLKGFTSDVPKTVGWSVGAGPAVEADFLAVESLGCACRELRVVAAELRDKPFDSLKSWAEQVCRRVNYLLEPIGPLEIDAETQQVLVRSKTPAKSADQTAYYEMLFAAPGSLRLRRYVRPAQSAQSQICDMRLTQEVLLKLVDDIVSAVPAATGE